MHKSSLIPNDDGVFPLESDMQGNLPVSFGKGATEKGYGSTSPVPYFILRRAEGKGPRERYLASRLSYLGHPFTESAVCARTISRFYHFPW